MSTLHLRYLVLMTSLLISKSSSGNDHERVLRVQGQVRIALVLRLGLHSHGLHSGTYLTKTADFKLSHFAKLFFSTFNLGLLKNRNYDDGI